MKITIEAKKLQNTDIPELGDYFEFSTGTILKINQFLLSPSETAEQLIGECKSEGVVAIWRPV